MLHQTLNIFAEFDNNRIILNGKIKFRYTCTIIYKEIFRSSLLNKVITMKSWVCKTQILPRHEERTFDCIYIFQNICFKQVLFRQTQVEIDFCVLFSRFGNIFMK